MNTNTTAAAVMQEAIARVERRAAANRDHYDAFLAALKQTTTTNNNNNNEQEDTNMNTTTTNTTTAARDLSALMTEAHKLVRTIRRPGDDYRVTLAACMRFLYEKRNARREWSRMTGDQQAEALRRMVYKRRARTAAECNAAGDFRPDPYRWTDGPDDVAEVVAEAWTRINKHFDRADEKGEAAPLAIIMSRACDDAARAVGNEYHRGPRAIGTRAGDDGGDRVTFIIDHAAPTAEPIAPDPLSYVDTVDALARVCMDRKDRIVLYWTAQGFNPREISERTAIPRRTVAHRLSVMRAAYLETVRA